MAKKPTLLELRTLTKGTPDIINFRNDIIFFKAGFSNENVAKEFVDELKAKGYITTIKKYLTEQRWANGPLKGQTEWVIAYAVYEREKGKDPKDRWAYTRRRTGGLMME